MLKIEGYLLRLHDATPAIIHSRVFPSPSPQSAVLELLFKVTNQLTLKETTHCRGAGLAYQC